jgi:trehalose 6-phosphate synthase/phosphatase
MSRPAAIINVANRLPVTLDVEHDKISKSSGGLVAALEGVSDEQHPLRWLGWPGSAIDDPQARRDIARKLDAEYHATPVFLSNDEVQGFYEGFSNSSLWPLLHYMPSRFRYEPAWWDHYLAANKRFADAVLEVARDGDIVWVHDYQLMLVPAMIRHSNPNLRIGFFLHTPFPAYEIFRCHPKRADLVAGLLGADLIGFHTFGYLRHYRDAVRRLLDLDSQITDIRHEGHRSHLGVYPIGINARRFQELLESSEFKEESGKLEETNRGKQVVLSVERMDYTKGIVQRLEAIDLFLAELKHRGPKEAMDAIKFVFVSVPSREGVEEYQELLEQVSTAVGRLNGKYATLHNSPIKFIHGSVTPAELAALYATAQVCIVTPLIDGMNLVAKEYVACQRAGAGKGEEPGVLILSEFAGAAEELFNAVIVNPYDAQSVASAIEEGLAMPLDERRVRMEPMRQRVIEFDAQWWAQSFIRDLSSRSSAEAKTESDPRQALQQLRAATSSKQRIALFLDYDGTLREIELRPAAAGPTKPLRELFDLLARRAREGVDTTIISGRVPQELEMWFGQYPFGLVAEHGASMCRPGETEWERLDRNVSYHWKEPIRKVLKLYEASTPGTWVEEKRSSLVWHYRAADPEFGTSKARQLAEELGMITSNDPVEIRPGRRIVEVTAASVSKSAAVNRVLDEGRYDLIVCAGDDATDESMFRLTLKNQIMIKVGEGETQAQYRLPNPQALRQFLTDGFTSN